MATFRSDLLLAGSFKSGVFMPLAESPVEAAWDQIEHIGTEDALARQSVDSQTINWEQHRRYAMVRIAQALEFRRSAMTMSMLRAR
jgi:hypothetical protein